MNLTINLSEISGDRGFVITGTDPDVSLIDDISSGGDFNGDGLDDIVLGAFAAGNQVLDGEAYVVFGKKNNTNINVNNLNGNNGFTISGTDGARGALGNSVNVSGDFNGDGFEDVIVSAPLIGEPVILQFVGEIPNRTGEAYVVFGKENGFDTDLDVNSLNGNNGFFLEQTNGFESLDFSGDVNGDGIDDIILGSPYTDRSQTYVVFGNADAFYPFSDSRHNRS